MPVLIVREIVKREIEVPNLSQQIKQAQADSKLSIEKVIRAIDISRTYWNRIVDDRDMTISVDLLRKIEGFFSVDFGVKFSQEPSPKGLSLQDFTTLTSVNKPSYSDQPKF